MRTLLMKGSRTLYRFEVDLEGVVWSVSYPLNLGKTYARHGHDPDKVYVKTASENETKTEANLSKVGDWVVRDALGVDMLLGQVSKKYNLKPIEMRERQDIEEDLVLQKKGEKIPVPV